MNVASDERGVVVAWLLKLVISLAIVGVVVYDAGAVAFNHVGLDSTAEDIALALSSDLSTASARTSSVVTTRAEELARGAGAKLVRATLDTEGTLRVRLARRADTLIVRRVEGLKRYGRAVVTARARVT